MIRTYGLIAILLLSVGCNNVHQKQNPNLKLAVDEVGKLVSLAELGVDYKSFITQLNATKIETDRLFRDLDTSDERTARVKAKLEESLGHFRLSRDLWGFTLEKDRWERGKRKGHTVALYAKGLSVPKDDKFVPFSTNSYLPDFKNKYDEYDILKVEEFENSTRHGTSLIKRYFAAENSLGVLWSAGTKAYQQALNITEKN